MSASVPTPTWAIYEGDCRKLVRELEPASVDTLITSPPYWRMRDYLHPDQIGQEPTWEEHEDVLVRLFRDARQALKPAATAWINYGDRYQDGCLQLMASKLALALIADGWNLEAHVIWEKSNAFPRPQDRRPTNSWESVFFFTLTAGAHFWNRQAATVPDCGRRGGGRKRRRRSTKTLGHQFPWEPGSGANIRDVWRMASSSRGPGSGPRLYTLRAERTGEGNAPTFPEELPERCIRLGCPPAGVVLDPFAGAGTTGAAAMHLGRSFVGFELNADNAAVARRRIDRAARGLDARDPDGQITLFEQGALPIEEVPAC